MASSWQQVSWGDLTYLSSGQSLHRKWGLGDYGFTWNGEVWLGVFSRCENRRPALAVGRLLGSLQRIDLRSDWAESQFRLNRLVGNDRSFATFNQIGYLLTDSLCIAKKLDPELIIFVPAHD